MPRSKSRGRLRSLKVSDGFKSFVLDQLEELGDVTPRSMFGGVGLYQRGVFFGILARDTLYMKVDDRNRHDYEDAGMKAFKPIRAAAARCAITRCRWRSSKARSSWRSGRASRSRLRRR